MGSFDYNRAGQLKPQFMLTWKMAPMENLHARHRFELIMLILWFYFTIWLGLQMKSQSHLSQELWCEGQALAACGGVPACFPFILQHKGCVWASVGGGGLSVGRWWPVTHWLPSDGWLQTQSSSFEPITDGLQVCAEHEQPRQSPAGPDPLSPASHKWSKLSGVPCPPAAQNRWLISVNSIWNQKMQFLR